MVEQDDFHSYLVGWSKIILPLCALALLSTLFLFSRSSNQPSDIPFAQIEEMAREQRITAPQFSGVTSDGSVISIAARSARPDAANPGTVSIDGIALTMDAADGTHLEVTGTLGQIDGATRVARLLGLARLETSTGYIMETNGLIADLDTGVVKSDGLLEIHTPFGKLTAGTVTFQASKGDLGQQILFTDGVHLIYTPQN